jgi:hypothetical protein
MLYVGSGSVTDALSERGEWTAYALGKYWPERFASLTLRCGFFVPDVEGLRVPPPAGIGMDSARRIWSDTQMPDGLWLTKSMYATPVSCLVDTMSKWLVAPADKRLLGVYHFGTQHALSRAFLRNSAGTLPLPSNHVESALQPLYREQWEESRKQGLPCPDIHNVRDACLRAAAIFSSKSKVTRM